MNDTPEQILVDEWIRQADRAKSMTGMDAIWFPDAEETLAVLRANGLLSEGAPSEDDREALIDVVKRNRSVVKRMSDGYPSVVFVTDETIADAILAAGFSRAAVPDAAPETVEVAFKTVEVERLGHLLVQLSPATPRNGAATVRRLMEEMNIKEVVS